MGAIVTAAELAAVSEQLRATGCKLVLTNGCFDLLHVGHVRYLQGARALGSALAVGVNGDASVRALKGANRPLNSELERAEVLAALACVDYVAIFPEVRLTNLIKVTRPSVYAKGGDYTPETLNKEERAALENVGAEIRILPFEEGHSTTAVIQRMAEPAGSSEDRRE